MVIGSAGSDGIVLPVWCLIIRGGDLVIEDPRPERWIGSEQKTQKMGPNIRTLFNFEPPATEEEIRASALQFVRKLSGFAKPSRANEAAFNQAVDEVTEVARRLLHSLETTSPARDREVEAAKARARARERYA